MKTERILYGFLGFAAVIIAFLIYRDVRRETQIQQFLSRTVPPEQPHGHIQDPYLQNEVKNRIIKGYGELQICYREYLKTNPKITDGAVKMDWQVDTDGAVISPEIVTSDFQSDVLHECLSGKINEWEFPEPPVKRYVTHIFTFKYKRE